MMVLSTNSGGAASHQVAPVCHPQYYFEHTKWNVALEAAQNAAGSQHLAWLMFSSATLYTVRWDTYLAVALQGRTCEV